jgi:hypothetical protein
MAAVWLPDKSTHPKSSPKPGLLWKSLVPHHEIPASISDGASYFLIVLILLLSRADCTGMRKF